MRRFATVAIVALAVALAAVVRAQPASPTAQREVDHLFAYLAGSGCEFFRNGEWADATKARDHLQTKYDYLRKRDLAPTAEAFIERAASTSSLSGKPYLVRCPGAAPVESGTWFRAELARYRAAPRR
jgi:uncharacterized protein YfiM (DUF2279 family)